MLSKIGTTELIVVLAIILLIFGPSKIPQLGKAIGQTIGNFKKGHKEGTSRDVIEGEDA